MSESNDWKTFRKIFNPTDRFERVENLMVSGMPDANYCIKGVEGWMELKSPSEPLRPKTPLFGSNHKLSQDQMNWWLTHNRAKGKGYILIASNKRWMAIPGRHSDIINTMTVEDLLKLADWHANKPVRKEKWKELYTLLGSRQNRTHTN